MKKISTLFLFSSMSLPAFALDYPNFDGFFAGISGGATQSQMTLNRQVDVRYSFAIFEEEFHSTSIGKVYRETPLAELDIGYGHVIPNTFLYLGGDIFGNLSHRQVTARPGNSFADQPGEITTGDISEQTSTSIQLNDFEYGLDIKPGIELSPFSLLYARIGAAFSKLRMDTADSFTLTDEVFTQSSTSTQLPVSSKKNVTGLRLGVGMNQLLTPHWALAADYIYTDYGKIGTFGIADSDNILAPPTPNGFTSRLNTSTSTQTIMLGLNYYFDPGINSTSLFPTDYTTSFFNGIYAGVAGGAIQNTVDRNINYAANFVVANLPPHEISLIKSAHHYDNSAIGEILVGYGHLLDVSHVYLGAETFLDVAGRGVSTKNSNISKIAVPPDSTLDSLLTRTKTDMNPVEVGADVKPGWVFGDKTLVYGIAGVVFNKLKIHSNNEFIFENNFAPTQPPVLASSLQLNPSKNVVGLRLGVGVEEAFTKHWSANFKYVYTSYGKIKVNGTGPTSSIGIDQDTGLFLVVVTPNGLSSEATGRLATQTEMLGISYHFN